MLDEARMRLPCGGELWFSFVDHGSSKRIDCVNVMSFPHVMCPGSYAKRKGCPYFDRLRKHFTVGTGLKEKSGEGVKIAVDGKTGVDDCDRVVRHVGEYDERGIVFCRRHVLYDKELRPKQFEEREDVFDECPYVKTGHGRIIAFFMRLFGRG